MEHPERYTGKLLFDDLAVASLSKSVVLNY